MAIDMQHYYEALERFLLKMEQLKQLNENDMHEIVSEMCEVLDIACCDLWCYATPVHEQNCDGDVMVFFETDSVDNQRCVVLREMTGDGSVKVYRACQSIGADIWTDAERSKVELFLKMVFAFHGRVNVMQLVERLSYHDVDLGIYNLTYFMRFTSMLISQQKIDKYTACYFNLKHFSMVNQQFGRTVGTDVMKRYVQSLQDMLSPEEIISRVGSDNFIMLILDENLDKVREYLHGAGVVCDAEQEEKIFISASQGYYCIPNDRDIKEPSEVVDCVTMAAKMAQDVANDDVVFFEDTMFHQKEQAKHIETMFPDALEKREFQVFYQPKIQLTDYRLVGAEALCRWFHDGKLMPPMDFIPVLEQGHEICDLDFYMLDRVCEDIRRWLDEGKNVVKVSVNFSRRHLSDMMLLEHILEVIDRHQVPHEYIEIELTETNSDVEFTYLKRVVSGLQKAGISTSVDDFGIGYSSLNLIREIPWNVLKIDRSFLPVERNVQSSKYIMLKYVIAMAQSMGLECIVEGVETIEQVKMLKDNNCYLAQGFYFDRPLPIEEFESRLSA